MSKLQEIADKQSAATVHVNPRASVSLHDWQKRRIDRLVLARRLALFIVGFIIGLWLGGQFA